MLHVHKKYKVEPCSQRLVLGAADGARERVERAVLSVRMAGCREWRFGEQKVATDEEAGLKRSCVTSMRACHGPVITSPAAALMAGSSRRY